MFRDVMGTLMLVGLCIFAVGVLAVSVYEKIRSVEIIEDDGHIEELAEDAIQKQLGADVDLSPFSKE